MPIKINRTSKITDLESRYSKQKAGSDYDVKKTLGNPGTSPAPGTTIDAASMNGSEFQSPNGFEVKVKKGITRFKDATGVSSKQLSRYTQGLDNSKYKG